MIDASYTGRLRCALLTMIALVISWQGGEAAALADNGAFVLAEEGEARAVIVLHDDAPTYTRQAAEDLADYLHRITGGTFEIVVEPPQGQRRIWVGDHPALADHMAGLEFDPRHPEQVLITAREDDLAILGRDVVAAGEQVESGTSAAVNTFLQEHMDMRWLWPGELGLDIIAQPTVVFEPFEFTYRPPLRQRQLRMSPYARTLRRGFEDTDEPHFIDRQVLSEKEAKVDAWRRFHRLEQGHSHRPNWFRATHAFGHWWDRYAEEEPELFAKQLDGTRSTSNTSRSKLCVSNPDVWDRWLEEAKQTLEENPWQTVLSASPNDNSIRDKCVCEDCRALDPDEGPMVRLTSLGEKYETVALTDRYVYFWNRLGELLEEEFPERDLYVGAWAYGPYRTPPVERNLRDNVAIGFVGSLSTSPRAAREQDRENWRQWAEKAPLMVWRPNLMHGPDVGLRGTPYLTLERLTEDMRFLADHHMVGMDVDASARHHWATQGPMYYFLAQLGWDPYADYESLRADYLERGFGPAAEEMSEYYQFFEDLQYQTLERLEGLNRRQVTRRQPEVYNEQVLAEANALLEAAERAASESEAIYRDRIAFVRTGLAFLEAQVAVVEAMSELRLARGGEMRERIRAALDAYEAKQALLEECFGSFAISAIHYWAEVENRRLTDFLGPLDEMYLALLEDREGVVDLPVEWDFRLDPSSVGEDRQWHLDESDAQWDRLTITSWWGDQLEPDDQDAAEMREYHGDAWYRTWFDKPTLADAEQLWLHFGAIDESCWVYVNGALVGEQVFDRDVDPDAWNKPRRFDITEHVREGENLLTVKVQALGGEGGIWRGAHLRKELPNRVENGRFNEDAQGWRLRHRGLDARSTDFDDAPFEGVMQVAFEPGEYVGEKGVRITKNDDELADLSGSSDGPFEPGEYRFVMRYKQLMDANAIGDAYMSIRKSFIRGGERENVWSRTPDEPVDDWAVLYETFELNESSDRVSITVFLRDEAEFWIDELAIEKLD